MEILISSILNCVGYLNLSSRNLPENLLLNHSIFVEHVEAEEERDEVECNQVRVSDIIQNRVQKRFSHVRV